MSAPIPDRIGRYAVRAVLGTGAFATVYRAHDGRLEGDVAIKVLAENHAFDAELRERFVLEGQLLRRMASPHILTVHDIGENERAQPYLVLELADRGDVRSRAQAARQAGRRPTTDELGRLCEAVASAMEMLHDAQVVHRDLAPGNLLLASPDAAVAGEVRGAGILADDERVVIADLGLSKDLARASGLTVGAGTAGFTPPEQRTAGGWVDARADIWSASALMVWLATGEPPGDEEAWRPQMAEAGWSARLVDALGHGLEADPGRRPASAASWRDDVLRALAPLPAVPDGRAEASPGTLQTGPGSVRSWRRRVLPILIVAALVVGAGISGWFLGRDGDPVSERTELPDGRARAVEAAHGIRLEVTGPRSTQVGEAARFRATVRGTDTAYWITGDGRTYPSSSQVDITPTSPGQGAVVLVARDDRGRVVDVSFTFEVNE